MHRWLGALMLVVFLSAFVEVADARRGSSLYRRTQRVSGYMRKNGTYVRSYKRAPAYTSDARRRTSYVRRLHRRRTRGLRATTYGRTNRTVYRGRAVTNDFTNPPRENTATGLWDGRYETNETNYTNPNPAPRPNTMRRVHLRQVSPGRWVYTRPRKQR